MHHSSLVYVVLIVPVSISATVISQFTEMQTTRKPKPPKILSGVFSNLIQNLGTIA